MLIVVRPTTTILPCSTAGWLADSLHSSICRQGKNTFTKKSPIPKKITPIKTNIPELASRNASLFNETGTTLGTGAAKNRTSSSSVAAGISLMTGISSSQGRRFKPRAVPPGPPSPRVRLRTPANPAPDRDTPEVVFRKPRRKTPSPHPPSAAARAPRSVRRSSSCRRDAR